MSSASERAVAVGREEGRGAPALHALLVRGFIHCHVREGFCKGPTVVLGLAEACAFTKVLDSTASELNAMPMTGSAIVGNTSTTATRPRGVSAFARLVVSEHSICLQAHDENNACNIGDLVKIDMSR